MYDFCALSKGYWAGWVSERKTSYDGLEGCLGFAFCCEESCWVRNVEGSCGHWLVCQIWKIDWIKRDVNACNTWYGTHKAYTIVNKKHKNQGQLITQAQKSKMRKVKRTKIVLAFAKRKLFECQNYVGKEGRWKWWLQKGQVIKSKIMFQKAPKGSRML